MDQISRLNIEPCGFMFRNLLKRRAYYATEVQTAIGAPPDMILKPENEKTKDGTPRFSQFKKDFHEKSRKLGQDLMDVLKKKAPSLIVADCLSCRLQFEQFTPFAVKHPIEVLL